jgi:hypothetical protein
VGGKEKVGGAPIDPSVRMYIGLWWFSFIVFFLNLFGQGFFYFSCCFVNGRKQNLEEKSCERLDDYRTVGLMIIITT